MSYVKWVRLKRAWVPVDQIPHMRPTPASPEEQDTQQQKSDQEAPTLPKPAVPPTPPTPVEPNFPENAPEALNIPEISEPIRRVRNN